MPATKFIVDPSNLKKAMKSLAILAIVAGSTFPQQALCFSDFLIYDNGAGGASGVDQFYLAKSPLSILADDFVVASMFRLTRIEWVGVYNGSVSRTDDFTLAFFADDSGSPMAGIPLVAFHVGNDVNRVDSGFDNILNSNIYTYSALVDHTFSNSSTYWLGITNASGSGSTYFTGGNGQSGGVMHGSGNQGQISWFNDPQATTLDFRLYGTTVPEPSSAAIAIASLFVFCCKRRR